jgi:Cu/Ag efflux protein CusF
MKKAIALIVSLLFVLSVAGLSFAAEKAVAPAAEKTVEKKAPVKVKWLTGEVTAVDAAANTVTVKGRKAELTLTANDKTSIKMGKEKKTLADVKVGDKVSTKYSEVEGKNVAKSIMIRSEMKTEKKAKKMEKKAEPAKE